MSDRKDMELIAELVPRGSRVLDLGCGSGELLAHLIEQRGCSGYGIELADANVHASLARGIDVIQFNLEDGLALFEDRSFDVVLQLDTLQHLRNTEKMLREVREADDADAADARGLAQHLLGMAQVLQRIELEHDVEAAVLEDRKSVV